MLAFQLSKLSLQMEKVLEELKISKAALIPAKKSSNILKRASSSNHLDNHQNSSIQTERKVLSNSNKYSENLNNKNNTEISSPKNLVSVRKSQDSPHILLERITLNKKRYDYKIAKNNSADHMGYTSHELESNENSFVKDITNNFTK